MHLYSCTVLGEAVEPTHKSFPAIDNVYLLQIVILLHVKEKLLMWAKYLHIHPPTLMVLSSSPAVYVYFRGPVSVLYHSAALLRLLNCLVVSPS